MATEKILAKTADGKMEALRLMARSMAHDMNNMLGAIEGYVTLSLRESGLPPQLRSDLEEIRKAVGKGSSLTRKLLAFSRRQGGAMRPVSPGEFISGLAARNNTEKWPVFFETQSGLPQVMASDVELETLFSELISNARDSMPGGGRISLSVEREGGMVRFTVADTGHGIPPEAAEHIFEPFFTTREKGKGQGLGLSIAYGIANQYGGSISAESEGGKGTRVFLLLPAGAGGVSAPVPESSIQPRERAKGPVSLLIIEDDSDLRGLASRALSEAGIKVTGASTIAEALRLLDEGLACDVLFADITLPDGDAVTSLPDFLKRVPNAVPIFTSGYMPEDEVGRSIRESGYKFMVKPYDLNRLADIVLRLAQI